LYYAEQTSPMVAKNIIKQYGHLLGWLIHPNSV
jgi:hypothetical protein